MTTIGVNEFVRRQTASMTQTITLSLQISSVKVLTGFGADTIVLALDQETSAKVHGDKIQFWKSADLVLRAAKGSYKTALEALGIEAYEVIHTSEGPI